MKRNNRRNLQEKSSTDKVIVYALIGAVVLAVIVFALFMYSKRLSDEVRNGTMSLEQMANLTNNQTNQNTESASTQIGKSVEESEENTTNPTNSINTTNSTSTNVTNANVTSNKTTNNVTSNSSSSTNTSNTTNSANTTNTSTNTNNSSNNSNTTNSTKTNSEPKKELTFEKPVEGEVVREYAKDNLIYSETLQEWVTHMGVDIKADKTTVVKSAEAGTVKSIKNDPRYGLTVVVEHDDNFQTVYSNLLTSEFVVEGEKIEKGQAIGTVGNTAVFEIADEPHLHFEILQNSLPVDPNIYIK